jgi:hypothetical protein
MGPRPKGGVVNLGRCARAHRRRRARSARRRPGAARPVAAAAHGKACRASVKRPRAVDVGQQDALRCRSKLPIYRPVTPPCVRRRDERDSSRAREMPRGCHEMRAATPPAKWSTPATRLEHGWRHLTRRSLPGTRAGRFRGPVHPTRLSPLLTGRPPASAPLAYRRGRPVAS